MIELILAARYLNLGGGFEVDRVLPSKRRTIGPFVLLDHGGPFEHPPGEGFGILPHPCSSRTARTAPDVSAMSSNFTLIERC